MELLEVGGFLLLRSVGLEGSGRKGGRGSWVCLWEERRRVRERERGFEVQGTYE